VEVVLTETVVVVSAKELVVSPVAGMDGELPPGAG
jgi:hypothetical protein